MTDCLRCGQAVEKDLIGSVLAHFVCSTCRVDHNEFAYESETRDSDDLDEEVEDLTSDDES